MFYILFSIYTVLLTTTNNLIIGHLFVLKKVINGVVKHAFSLWWIKWPKSNVRLFLLYGVFMLDSFPFVNERIINILHILHMSFF